MSRFVLVLSLCSVIFWSCLSCSKEKNVNATLPELSVTAVDTSSFELTWNLVKDVNAYILSIAQDERFEQPLPEYEYNSVLKNKVKVGGLLSDKDYYCRLKVDTYYGFSDYTPPFRVRTNKPQSPKVYMDYLSTDSVTFRWQSDKYPGAYYQVNLSDKKDFSNTLKNYDRIPSKDTVLTIRSLERHKGYYARFRSVRGNGYTYYTVIDFRTKLTVPKIKITQILDESFNLEWLQVPDARSYSLQISEDPKVFEKPYLVLGINPLYSTRYDVTGLKKDKIYYFRIASNSTYPGASSVYSAPRKAVTGSDILTKKINVTSVENVTPVSFRLNWGGSILCKLLHGGCRYEEYL